jgi:hypothetical protein
LQIAAVLLPTFNTPAWVLKAFIVFISFGFIIALILAWAFEMTPEGIKRETEVGSDDSITADTGRKLNCA